MTMARLPLTLRMLVLVPLVAAGIDLTRATVACGQGAQTCLEAAGQGWLGPFAVLLVVLAAASVGVTLARARPQRRTSFAANWALGTVGVTAAVTAQALIARSLSDAPLAGSPLGVLALCVLGGALVAAAMKGTEAARALSPSAPRVVVRTTAGATLLFPLGDAVEVTTRDRPKGRAPPTH